MEKVLIQLHLRKDIHTIEGNIGLDIELELPGFSFITLFGNSGVGKTTILRMIAGLTKPDSGYIRVGNENWFDSDKGINIKPQDRNIGFVFQDYALFPNMTIEEHLYYAQQQRDAKQVNELLNIFNLEGLKNRKPDILSGGQKQRAAVARALARKPGILLLDEPLSALDSDTRETLQKEIIEAHKSFNATTILVSHDIDEITRLTDKVYIIGSGRIIKSGKPEEVFVKNQSDSYSFTGKIISIAGKELKLSADESEIEKLKSGESIKITPN